MNSPSPEPRPGISVARDASWALVVIGAVAAGGLVLRDRLAPIDLVMLFLLAVVVVGATARRWAVLLATALAMLTFNFLFVPPYYTFSVDDGRFMLTFAVMAGVGLAMGELTTRLREQREAVLRSEAAATALRAEQARARLRIEAEQLRSALLSSLSHDLRTPLAAIEGSASTLIADGEAIPQPDRLALLGTIQGEAQRMHRLVGNLLEMVRVESGALVPQASLQPIDEVIGVALHRLDHLLTGHRLITDLPASLPPVLIDELLIEQVFVNVLENAARHAPAGSTIHIGGAESHGGGIEVRVVDNGSGIPVGNEETVFEKFVRGPGALGDGIGLGLTISRGIIAAHGGTIRAEPTPGGGATIVIALPGEPSA